MLLQTQITFFFIPLEHKTKTPKLLYFLYGEKEVEKEWLENNSLYTEKRKSFRFGMAWGWVNDDTIFISGWTIPLSWQLETVGLN